MAKYANPDLNRPTYKADVKGLTVPVQISDYKWTESLFSTSHQP